LIARDFTFANVRLASQAVADYLKAGLADPASRAFTAAKPASSSPTIAAFWAGPSRWRWPRSSPPTA
jgi:hypothetical protein